MTDRRRVSANGGSPTATAGTSRRPPPHDSAPAAPRAPAGAARADPSGGVVGPARPASAASPQPSFLRRHGLRLLAWGLMLVQVLVVVVAANLSRRSPGLDGVATGLALFAVPLATWAACRDLDALVRRLTRNGLLGGLLRATVGAGFIAGMPLLFATLESAAAPAAAGAARTLATLLPLAVAAGLEHRPV